MNNSNQRRRFIKSSAFGLIGITAFGNSSAQDTVEIEKAETADSLFYRYPSINDTMASGIVGASHGNFDKVKELVNSRPELAGASWDWGFGDWETALGAASHVGRRDIAEFLMSHGARPDIFTYTMLGMLKSVQEIIETVPGIQSHAGPHGITLLQHAKNRLKKKYAGEYRFGNGEAEIFVVDTHRLGFLQIGRKGSSPRKLNKIDVGSFSPAGAPSVKIIFKTNNDKAVSLSIHEPEPLVTAVR